MKSIYSLFALCSIFITIISCSSSNNKKEITQLESSPYAVVLEPETAIENNNRITWNFKPKHSGKYYVQLLRNGIHKTSNESINIAINNDTIKEPLLQSFVINKTTEPQTVSSFKKTIDFKNNVTNTVSISSNIPFTKIRLVPHHSNHISSGKYKEEWLAMHHSKEKQEALKWFNNAKYGMFIHWGLYSQAGGVWDNTKIENSPYPGPRVAEWLMSTFRISRDDYQKLAKTFNPDISFAENIAKLAKEAGMKYVVITSKHHDGFALFDSEVSEYDMVDATPYKKDAIKELYNACLKEGLEFGVYYSHGNDWMDGSDGNVLSIKKRNDSLGLYTHMNGKNYWDPSSNSFESYIENKALPQVKELLALLPKLRIIWFDGEGNITEDQSFKFYKTIYNINPNVLVTRRVGFGFGDYEDAGDNVIPSGDEVLEKQWETCGTTNNSWGYKPYDQDWKSTKETLYYIINIASKGGNYLLNIGPDGNGNVPEESANILREVGDWLNTNGDAIYGTTRWKIINEGDRETLLGGTGHRAAKGFNRSFTKNEFWFTTKNNTVYAISLVPSSTTILIRSLNNQAGEIKDVSILNGHPIEKWSQTEEGLLIHLKTAIQTENGFAVKINM